MGLFQHLTARVERRRDGGSGRRRIPVRPSARLVIALCLIVTALCLSLAAFTQTASRRVLFEQRSPYGRVLVVEERGLRCLRFEKPDAGNQSCMDLRKPERVVFEYVRHSSIGLTFVPKPERALLVGIGGGSIIHMYHGQLPDLQFDAVDIDPMVVEAAELYFDVSDRPGLRVITQDGRKFLETSKEQWDLIFLVAYGEENVPFALTTVEFLRAVAARLEPDGAVVANIWRDNIPLFHSMLKTYGRVFAAVHVFPTPTHYNAIVVATLANQPLSRAAIVQRSRPIAAQTSFNFNYLAAPASYRPLASYDLSKASVLVDQYPDVHGCLMEPYTSEADCAALGPAP